jgi:predicted glycosyltransferase
VLAADRPFICIPQDRPFDEQRTTARRLDEVGAALSLPTWPKPEQWPGLLDRALALCPQARCRLHDANGAHAAAAWIGALADDCVAVREKTT